MGEKYLVLTSISLIAMRFQLFISQFGFFKCCVYSRPSDPQGFGLGLSTDPKTQGYSSVPLYKMPWYLYTTYMHPPIYFKPSLDCL